jgi:hypothetical protein
MSYSYTGRPGASPLTGPKANGMAVTGLVLSIISWILFLGSIAVNLLMGIAALATMGLCAICGVLTVPLMCLSPLLWLIGGILSGVGLSQVNQDPASYSPASKSLAIVGLVLNVAGILMTLCFIVVTIVLPLLGMAPLLTLPFLEGLELPTPSPY